MARKGPGKYIRPRINKLDGYVRSEKENIHHILASSRGGSNATHNKVALYRTLHEALHRMYGTGTPVEQIKQLLSINAPALTEGFLDDIANILKETDNKYYYKNGVLLPK